MTYTYGSTRRAQPRPQAAPMSECIALENASHTEDGLTWPQMQRLADLYALAHMDTPEAQHRRLHELKLDTDAYEVGRPRRGAA